MNKSGCLLIAVLGVCFLSTSLAWAGFESGGGGAFVCRDKDQNILKEPLSVEVLDLWEAGHLYKLDLNRDDYASLSIQQDIDLALAKLKSWDPLLYRESIGFVPYNKPTMQPIDDSTTEIAKPTDVGSLMQKRGCPLEGAASYDDISGILSYDPEILNAMGPVDYAALMVHEAVYKGRRMWNHDTNSIEARRIVGFLFSREPVPAFNQNLSKGTLSCETTPAAFSFTLSREPSNLPTFSNWIVFQFSRVAGIRPMAVTEMKIPDTETWASGLYDGTIQNLSMTIDPPPTTFSPSLICGLDLMTKLERFPMISVWASRADFPVIHCHAQQ